MTGSAPDSSRRASWDLSWERSAQVGSLLATLVLETVGPQEYQVRRDDFLKRLDESYGPDGGRRRPALLGCNR